MNSRAKAADTVDASGLILEQIRRKSVYKGPSDAEVLIARKMLELIQRGEIGLVFNDPDDCERDWSEAAVIELVKVILSADRKFLIDEILEECVALHYPMQKLMEQHPDYPAKCEKWESKNGISQGPDPMQARKDEIESDMSVRPYRLRSLV